MTLFILSFIIMIVFVLALSLGVLFGRHAIKGSCGAAKDIPSISADGVCSGACGKRNMTDDAPPHVCPRSGR